LCLIGRAARTFEAHSVRRYARADRRCGPQRWRQYWNHDSAVSVG